MCCDKLKILLSGIKEECISNSTVAQENGKKITFKSYKAEQICKLKVDDCHLPSGMHKKCDYLFYTCSSNEIHLVELKGTDVETACLQIAKTYDIISNDIHSRKNDIGDKVCIKTINFKGYLISSSVPNATEIKFRKMQDKIKKEKGFLIKKYHKQHSV